MQDGVTAPLVKQCEDLKGQLGSKDAALHGMAMDCEHLAEENRHLKYQLKRLDAKLAAKDRCAPLPRCRCCPHATSPRGTEPRHRNRNVYTPERVVIAQSLWTPVVT